MIKKSMISLLVLLTVCVSAVSANDMSNSITYNADVLPENFLPWNLEGYNNPVVDNGILTLSLDEGHPYGGRASLLSTDFMIVPENKHYTLLKYRQSEMLAFASIDLANGGVDGERHTYISFGEYIEDTEWHVVEVILSEDDYLVKVDGELKNTGFHSKQSSTLNSIEFIGSENAYVEIDYWISKYKTHQIAEIE